MTPYSRTPLIAAAICISVLPGAAAPAPSYPAGPLPSAGAPVAVAVDATHGRVYVVHRHIYESVGVNFGLIPTDRLSVVDQATGNILAAIPLGNSVNGLHQGIAVDTARNLVYVGNADDATVSIISGVSNTVQTTTPVGCAPTGIAADSSAGIVYVACGTGVTLLDASSGAVTGVVSSGASFPLNAVALDPSTHLAYAVSQNTIYQIDGVTKSLKASIPYPFVYTMSAIVVDPGQAAYVLDHGSHQAIVLDLTKTPPIITNTFYAGTNAYTLAFDSTSHLLYVPNPATNQVLVYDGSGALQSTVPVLHFPNFAALDIAGHKAYVTDVQSDSLSVINTQTQTVSAHWPLGTSDWGLAVDSAGGKLYISNYVADAVSVVSTSTHALLHSWTTGPNSGPNAMGVDPALQQVYARGANDGSLVILSTVDGSIRKTISTTGGSSTSGLLAVNRVTHQVYIAGSNITVLDGNTNNVAGTITVGSKPVGVAIDETANKIYVANNLSGTISVIDGNTNAVTATWTPPLPSGSGLWGLDVDPALHRLFLVMTANVNGNANGLMTLDSTTGAFIGQVITGVFGYSWAQQVAVNRTTHDVFLTDQNAGTAIVVNGHSPTVILAQIDCGWNPIGLAVDETGGLVYVANSGDGTFSVIPDSFSLVAVTVQTTPSGLSYSVDGANYTASHVFNWIAGDSHTIATTSPQSGVTGTRYAWNAWSDGGAISHSITVPVTAATYTASFTTQYLLTTAVSPPGTGSVTPSPLAPAGYYNSGQQVQLTASPNAGYQFASFSGDLTGSANPQSLIMSAPRTVTANFTVITYTISGQIRLANNGLNGVTVTLSGSQSGSTSTSGWGTYSFSGLAAGGNYTVTPSLSGYTFGPSSLTVTSLNGNQTANFTTLATPTLQFYPIAPCRIADTRGFTGPPGPLGPPSMPAGSSRSFPVLSSACGIPPTAVAYSLNVSAVPLNGYLQYLTVWPTGQPMPVASVLNSWDGRIVANAATIPAGAGGAISIYASDATDVFFDINGYLAPPGAASLAFYPVPPCRIADTRSFTGPPGPLGPPSMTAQSSRSFPVLSSACGIPASAVAYSLNVSAVPLTSYLGYLTAWGTGQPMPIASTLNSWTGTIVANAAIVPAGAGGAISIYVSDATDVFFDINGYFAPPGPGGLQYHAFGPCRVADTRSFTGPPGPLGPPSMTAHNSRSFPVLSSACGIPATAAAYAFNMTAVPAAGYLQYLTTWGTGQPMPVASTLNSWTGTIVANAAIVPAGTAGAISIYVTDLTDVFFDINGYFAP